jgi:hypothetical protein
MNIILRLLVAIPLLFVVWITNTYYAFRTVLLFTKYGGEWITYKKEDKITIYNIYEKLKKNEQTN